MSFPRLEGLSAPLVARERFVGFSATLATRALLARLVVAGLAFARLAAAGLVVAGLALAGTERREGALDWVGFDAAGVRAPEVLRFTAMNAA